MLSGAPNVENPGNSATTSSLPVLDPAAHPHSLFIYPVCVWYFLQLLNNQAIHTWPGPGSMTTWCHGVEAGCWVGLPCPVTDSCVLVQIPLSGHETTHFRSETLTCTPPCCSLCGTEEYSPRVDFIVEKIKENSCAQCITSATHWHRQPANIGNHSLGYNLPHRYELCYISVILESFTLPHLM